MLVIRRRPGESVFIGDDVEIEILDSTSSQVKLGIRAPKEVAVLRKEVHLTRQQNRAAASLASPGGVTPETLNRLLDSILDSRNSSPGR
jgi:carbon storage regulator